MTEKIDQLIARGDLILEHLRQLRDSQNRLGEDIADIKHRLTSLEGALVTLRDLIPGP